MSGTLYFFLKNTEDEAVWHGIVTAIRWIAWIPNTNLCPLLYSGSWALSYSLCTMSLEYLLCLHFYVWVCFIATCAEDKIVLFCLEACTVSPPPPMVKALLMLGSADEERQSADESFRSPFGFVGDKEADLSLWFPPLGGRRKLCLFGVLNFTGYLLS